MNAQNDYVLKMSKDELPPATAFWSLTLYDLENGFFIPNDQKKYSVGENAGYKLNSDGGIEIVVSATKPDSVPEENWLPINRSNLEINGQFRIYVPDAEKMMTWKSPLFIRVVGSTATKLTPVRFLPVPPLLFAMFIVALPRTTIIQSNPSEDHQCD